jgi:hypothetical protein
VVDEYALECGRVPPAAVLPGLLADLDEAWCRLGGAPDALRLPMARACGQLSSFAATEFLSVGDSRSARRYWRTALRAIDQSGDRRARAMLHGKRAIFGLFGTASSPAASLAHADEAIGIAGGSACPGLAEGHAARALALSVLGDHRGSVEAARDLGDVFARLPGTTAGSVTSLGWSEQKLCFIQGRVYARAGRSADAMRVNAAGLALVPGDTPVPLADFALSTAAALIRSGDPAEGARHVVRTIEALPAGYRQSAVVRQSAASALGLVPAGAAGVPAVTEARELLALPRGGGS